MTKTKLKAIHIHTDLKFLHQTKMFQGGYFTNTSIVLIKNKATDVKNTDALLYGTEQEDLQRIVDLCTQADLVVLYDLNPIKIKIVLALPKEVKIAWRFFGYELYSKRPDLFKSDLSRKYDKKFFSNNLRRILSRYYNLIFKGNRIINIDSRVLNRINYFLAISQEEYDFLKFYWPNLPQFIKVPYFHLKEKIVEVDFQKKQQPNPVVIIGNNRSSYNNHLDLIEIIDNNANKKCYNFTLFFNYGSEGDYAKEVIKKTVNKNYFIIINNFLNKEDFTKIYQNAAALVINGYRQMAGANIRAALANGVKVYLNHKNVHKQFLENQGFKLFSIEDFEADLKNNKLGLDKTIALHNVKNFNRIKEAYTRDDFQKKFLA
jgi:dTDP-N-acetylfucosamine:lipid II N-acetylfucosaminyltransferase